MDPEYLTKLLKVLSEHNVSVFRTKDEDEVLEIVFKDQPSVSSTTEVELEDEPKPYATSNIGIRFESFE